MVTPPSACPETSLNIPGFCRQVGVGTDARVIRAIPGMPMFQFALSSLSFRDDCFWFLSSQRSCDHRTRSACTGIFLSLRMRHQERHWGVLETKTKKLLDRTD